MPDIVILDGYTTNPGDLSWDPIAALGNFQVHDRTPENKIIERSRGADILVVNKTRLDRQLMEQLPGLRLICTLATGYNNIDIPGARHCGITVCNAVGYSTPSVAQHVFSLLLEMTNHVALHNQSVQDQGWTNAPDWCYWKETLSELTAKTMGIYGFGKIGRQVAQIALAFGMQVIANRRDLSQTPPPGVEYVGLEKLFANSDVLTLHAPLSEENAGVVNANNLSLMKPSAYLINTGRGGLVNEADVRKALLEGKIAGAGLDVLSKEPPPPGHPLIGLKNCILTPHQAWATQESRGRLIQIVAENISAFLEGKPQFVVSE